MNKKKSALLYLQLNKYTQNYKLDALYCRDMRLSYLIFGVVSMYLRTLLYKQIISVQGMYSPP